MIPTAARESARRPVVEDETWKAARRFEFTTSEWRDIHSRARGQERIFGRNNGTFTAKVDKDYTGKGVAGEIAVRRLLIDMFGLDPEQVRLSGFGDKYDVFVNTDGADRGIHVKTGAYKNWPGPSSPFGVHGNQGIQSSGAPVVLVFLRKIDNAFGNEVRVAGWIPPWHLAGCPVVERGETFPGTTFASKTRNIVTHVGDYGPILDLEAFLGPHPATPPAPAAPASAGPLTCADAPTLF